MVNKAVKREFIALNDLLRWSLHAWLVYTYDRVISHEATIRGTCILKKI